MITNLKLVNFRNFSDKKLENLNEKNFIIWENGKWKTNILEAISLLTCNSITWLWFEDLIKQWENNCFIEYEDDIGNKIAISYEKETNKKKYLISTSGNTKGYKSITKNKFKELTCKSVIFSPIIMNLMYLSPDLRRDFLDEAISNSFSEYEKFIKEYKHIVRQRNKMLKYIHEWKSTREEIVFWDNKFIEWANNIYQYRFKLVHFFASHISSASEYFNNSTNIIEFIYKTKVSQENTLLDLKKYLEKNIERDIILWKTQIWPHVDDFDILIGNVSLTHFASRGETKSIIIWLKLLETVYIEKMTWKKPILIIDDLLSELDINHKNMLTKKIKYYQTFITSIDDVLEENIIRI